MGSLYDSVDVNEDIMAVEVTNKRHTGGLEAPRNSLELQMETSNGLYSVRNNLLYAHHMENVSYGKDYYFTEAPLIKLTGEEISSHSQNAPSVVARLMGLDMLPIDSERESDAVCGINNGIFLMNTKPSKNGSFEIYVDRYTDQLDGHVNSNSRKLREHPQEEQIQKFKKEFEAWLRLKERADNVNVSSAPARLTAREDLDNPKRTANTETRTEPNDHAEMVIRRDSLIFRSGKRENFDIVPEPAKVVILRTGPDKMDVSEGSWYSTPSTSEERGGGGIEDFLEEVKERLESEVQGKCPKTRTYIRGGGIETPYREKPSEVRDNVSMELFRSESTRSYGSTDDSPEFVNRDTRRFLAERSRNVTKGEIINRQVPVVIRNISRLSVSDYDGHYLGDTWVDSKISRSDSFRYDLEKPNMSSTRDLIRSLSAPVSGASFGKLLLEDRNILSGAGIRRKHEVFEKVPLNIVKKKKKDKFNLREKVLSFRYNLTLRGRLFRRRVKPVKGSDQNENDRSRDIRNGPTVMMRFCDTYENHTEVPPSPASVCSSVHEEIWTRGDYLISPISSSGGHQLDDDEMSHVFREMSSNLNELRRSIDRFEGAVPEETVKREKLTELEVDIEDEVEAYVRDLLVASGLCDVPCSRSLMKWDPLGKPISSRVFEQVKKTYDEKTKDDERFKKTEGEKINHKMVLDLLNEVLPALLVEQVNMYGKVVAPTYKPLHGRNLVSRVWSVVRMHVHPRSDGSCYALDNVLTRDSMSTTLWSTRMNDDVDYLGRDIECQITDELVYEVVKDICTFQM